MTLPTAPQPTTEVWFHETANGTVIVISDPGRTRLRSIVLRQLAQARRKTPPRRSVTR
ncbi:hypothetical protein [Kitasatospora sp. NPDC059327]|uniref:hypothetical protein n=1 Tax=Kitasatospora sp. NPDC059327 TaxID=3346803 RepID=UPI00368567C6